MSEPASVRRRNRRRTAPRAKTVAARRLSKDEIRSAELLVVPDVERPRTRADCLPGGCNAVRPCPFVSCKYHLYLDVDPTTGSMKLNFPHLDIDEVKESCVLDVADRGGVTLEETGEIMNLTRERIRQVEVRGLLRLKMAGDVDPPSDGE